MSMGFSSISSQKEVANKNDIQDGLKMSNGAPKQEPPYGLRMPPDLKTRVKAAAEANNRSMNAEIVAALEERYPALNFKDMTFQQLANYIYEGATEIEVDARIEAVNRELKGTAKFGVRQNPSLGIEVYSFYPGLSEAPPQNSKPSIPED